MTKRVLKTPPARVYAGRYGECAGCGEPTPVRLIGLDVDVSQRVWTASSDLLAAVFEDLSRPEVLKQHRAVCQWCARPVMDKHHYWMGFEDSPVYALIGPCCSRCVQEHARSIAEDMNGRGSPVIAYEVRVTAKVVERVRRSEHLSLPSNEDREPARKPSGCYPLF